MAKPRPLESTTTLPQSELIILMRELPTAFLRQILDAPTSYYHRDVRLIASTMIKARKDMGVD